MMRKMELDYETTRVREKIVNSHVLTCIYRSEPLEFEHDVDENFLNDIVRPRISSYLKDGLKLNMAVPNDLGWSDEERDCSSSHEPLLGSSLGWSIETEKLAGKDHFIAVCDYCARDFVIGDIIFDPVKLHQRWCPVLDINEDDGVPLWKLIYSCLTPTRQRRASTPATLKKVESAKRVLERSLSVISKEVPIEM
ncbi:Zinc finger domain containing protein [Trichostrongylus colubriformis]|uniref:Zinc finger domain containing protein n=1 Tax=Trichostrongylus colubriformis TaxID=6319 RepID=A0AAN8FMC4_TRICO